MSRPRRGADALDFLSKTTSTSATSASVCYIPYCFQPRGTSAATTGPGGCGSAATWTTG